MWFIDNIWCTYILPVYRNKLFISLCLYFILVLSNSGYFHININLLSSHLSSKLLSSSFQKRKPFHNHRFKALLSMGSEEIQVIGFGIRLYYLQWHTRTITVETLLICLNTNLCNPSKGVSPQLYPTTAPTPSPSNLPPVKGLSLGNKFPSNRPSPPRNNNDRSEGGLLTTRAGAICVRTTRRSKPSG